MTPERLEEIRNRTLCLCGGPDCWSSIIRELLCHVDELKAEAVAAKDVRTLIEALAVSRAVDVEATLAQVRAERDDMRAGWVDECLKRIRRDREESESATESDAEQDASEDARQMLAWIDRNGPE